MGENAKEDCLKRQPPLLMAIIFLTGLKGKFNLMSEQKTKTEPHLEAPRSFLMIFNCLDIISWKIIVTTTIARASKPSFLREYGCVIMNK